MGWEGWFDDKRFDSPFPDDLIPHWNRWRSIEMILWNFHPKGIRINAENEIKMTTVFILCVITIPMMIVHFLPDLFNVFFRQQIKTVPFGLFNRNWQKTNACYDICLRCRRETKNKTLENSLNEMHFCLVFPSLFHYSNGSSICWFCGLYEWHDLILQLNL